MGAPTAQAGCWGTDEGAPAGRAPLCLQHHAMHAPATHSLFSASSKKRERLCTRLDSSRSFFASTCKVGRRQLAGG